MSYFDHFVDSPGTAVGDLITRLTTQRIFGVVKSFMSGPACAILEIGPGRGDLAELFRRNAYMNYTVVEPNVRMRQDLIGRGFAAKDYLIPFLAEADCSYDAVVLIDVFEHLHDVREAESFLAETWRVLRPDGLLCIHSPDFLHWQADFFNCDFTHNNVTTVRRTLQMFHEYRFRTLTYVYLSAFLSGALATAFSWLTRVVLCFAPATASIASFTSSN